jgi:RND family efflux transporter MFP subunit
MLHRNIFILPGTPAMTRFFSLPLVAVAVAGLSFSTFSALAQGAPPAPPVTVAAPLARKVAQWDEYTGRFEAVSNVEIRARVSGFIDRVAFTDGALVKKGDPLFVIDQRPYRIAVEAARADVAKAKAQVDVAQTDVGRANSLQQSHVLSQRDIDQRRATLNVAKATALAAEAELDTAELNLTWTEVRAPISGRISDKKVDVGNLISGGQAGATLLTTIVSTDPINFVFEASEADYVRYSRLAKEGARPSSREAHTPVQVRLSDESQWNRTGAMDFLDNQVNPRSGTIRGRAVFANHDNFLTPGTFGRMRLFGGDIEALMVPDASIVADQARKIVMVVGPDSKVVGKPVTLGPIIDGLRVVRSGLSRDDKVIITGLANPFVRPGVQVVVQAGTIQLAATN